MKQHSSRDTLIVGFALFSMFFGAGNVVFPPYLGVGSGPQWLAGFTSYYLADIGLAMLTLFAILRKGNVQNVFAPVGKIPATVLLSIIVLCIGPFLAIPRTAATTFEMAVAPLTSAGTLSKILFPIFFFLLVFLFSVRENSVVDLVGKILTPILLVGLCILIVRGIVFPLGEIAPEPRVENAVVTGIRAGYQTMDVLGTMLFGVFILHTVENKGYSDHKKKVSITRNAGLVAAVILLVVYGGLTYLGATVSSVYELSISRADLVLSIVNSLLGTLGTVIFAVVVAMACLTTAVGLISSCADYFSNLTHGKLPYVGLVLFICVFSAVVSNLGLEQIVEIAGPVLDLIYPPALALVVLSFLPKMSNATYRVSALTALIFSAISSYCRHMDVPMPFRMPLASVDLGWVLPTLVLGFLTWFVTWLLARRQKQ